MALDARIVIDVEDGGGAWFAAAMPSSFEMASVLDEYRLMGTPRGFDPAEISVVRIWQGDEDTSSARGGSLSAAIPGSTLTVVPGEGTSSPTRTWPRSSARRLSGA